MFLLYLCVRCAVEENASLMNISGFVLLACAASHFISIFGLEVVSFDNVDVEINAMGYIYPIVFIMTALACFVSKSPSNKNK